MSEPDSGSVPAGKMFVLRDKPTMGSTIKRVVVMGDILRPWPTGDQFTSGAFRNIQWTYHLIAHAIKACGKEIFAFDWSHHALDINYKIFEVAEYYDAKGMEITTHSWSSLVNLSTPCQKLEKLFEEALKDALVVGYEMSKLQIATLEDMGVPYIDFALHPIRFMQDILHGARTNSTTIHAVLQNCHLNSDLAYESAGQIMAKVARFPKTVNTAVDTGLLLGQVWTDRAVSKPDGGFYKLDDFYGPIKNIVHRHAGLLYKPHPYEGISGDKSTVSEKIKSITVTKLNYYTLLSQPTISAVYGLNSSALYEARYFGRKYEYLIAPQYKLNDESAGNDVIPGDFVTIADIWTTREFWAQVLGLNKIRPLPDKDVITPNKLRRSMNTDWEFGSIDKLVVQL